MHKSTNKCKPQLDQFQLLTLACIPAVLYMESNVEHLADALIKTDWKRFGVDQKHIQVLYASSLVQGLSEIL